MLTRLAAITLVLSALAGGPVLAQNTDQTELLDRATIAINSMRRDENVGPSFKNVLGDAKGIIIVPSLIKGGFIVGGEGGNGVLLARLPDGNWSAPAFMFVGGASIGLQIGGSVSELVLTVMTDKGLNAVLQNKLKLGADASVALGPVGGSVGAATTTAAGADIYSYAISEGLFAGGAFEGAVITQKSEWDRDFYGKDISTEQIIKDPSLNPPAAETLRGALAAS